LALIPVLVAVLAFALMVPRATGPEAIPLPNVDERVLVAAAAHDAELAAKAQREELPGVVRALGSAIRDFNSKQAGDAEELVLSVSRNALNTAILPALADGADKLAILRAVQVETFLVEVRRFEQTGKESTELQAVGGPFVRRMRFSGWVDEKNHIALDESERRVAFKAAWNGVLGLDSRPELALSLDETRVLYRLFLRLPHAPEALRDQIDASRRASPSAKACADLAARERLAMEAWRLEKIRKLGTLDPTYPRDYAVGVAEFRRGQFPAAASAFRAWLASHPDGPLSLRARNHLKAAIELGGY
jgi:hypothetical protein